VSFFSDLLWFLVPLFLAVGLWNIVFRGFCFLLVVNLPLFLRLQVPFWSARGAKLDTRTWSFFLDLFSPSVVVVVCAHLPANSIVVFTSFLTFSFPGLPTSSPPGRVSPPFRKKAVRC